MTDLFIAIREDTWLEACNISSGAFAPLRGFMSAAEYASTVHQMRLPSGEPWTLPVTLDVPERLRSAIEDCERLYLTCGSDEPVVEIHIEDVFAVDSAHDSLLVFGTRDRGHPGVALECSLSPIRVGGRVNLLREPAWRFPELALTPAQTKQIFAERGWKTIVGFQTRNPLHRAHEYLHRLALELHDGLLLHPLIGWKKPDDFSPRAVIDAYRRQIAEFYPSHRVILAALRTPMRYAGPREAVFHAIIRRNHGCTHFIVGRDHAGVGAFYGTYDAQQLCSGFTDLGISILALKGPYFCTRCGQVVTERSCRHGDAHALSISGTAMRSMLSSGKRPPEDYMRTEISEVLCELAREGELFVGELE